MAETANLKSEPKSLFSQIAIKLAIVACVFALLDVAIVVPMYATDDQALAVDFIDVQAERVSKYLGTSDSSDLQKFNSDGLKNPMGVSSFGVIVFDSKRNPIFRKDDASSGNSLNWPNPATLDWTRRDKGAVGTHISGVRRFESKAGTRWILISAEAVGRRLYWPAIGRELLAHVALPLIPLTLLLLMFNVQVVSRMLAPLEQAAREVDTLDANRMEARLTTPTDSREAAALVRAVNRALDRLQHAMTLLHAFTADAAHELRTPLSVLSLRIDLLPPSPTKDRLREEVQMMSRLVNQMLDLAQADALSLENASDVDLLTLARDVVSQTAPLAFAGGKDIRLIDEGGSEVRGHADALGRVLRNLIENAINHSQNDQSVDVIVGPGARFAVRDYGPGLPDGAADKLFDRFWRKERAREGGAGLGLGIARSIIEAHGGVISAANANGGGALFVCELPPGRLSKFAVVKVAP